MARPPRPPAAPPTREQLLAFIKDSKGRVSRRELVRAFGLSADDRPALRKLLHELEGDGSVERGYGRRVGAPGTLPETMVVQVTGTDSDGDLLARPVNWEGDGPPPRIFVISSRRGEALGQGDRVLARMSRAREGVWEARPIRRLTEGPARMLGVYKAGTDETAGGRLLPVDKKQRAEYSVAARDLGGALTGELVMTELLPGGKPYGPRPVRVVERLGSLDDPRALSLVAIHAHGIPAEFPNEALEQAGECGAAELKGRDDLRAVPLVTIDGEDARDFDDAVWAEPDGDGWHVAVAIADVAWYVRPGDALDREAFKRGNSVYFPDRVVPMLPEELSNGWCSLKPNEDRPCMVAEMWFDAQGNKTRHVFRRALMRSAARLTYTQVQRAIDGEPDDLTGPLVEPILKPLYAAWAALLAARHRRGPLELDLPERQVFIKDGNIERVIPRTRFDSHRLIEDFMIAANVAAAEQIEAVHRPCMYRVHDNPSLDKLEALNEVLRSLDLGTPRGQALRPELFNRILEQVKGRPEARMISELVLRSQAQAAYSPENLGHFGLALAHYAHFTSPIRRYSDLLVHRALIDGLHLGPGGLTGEEDMGEMGVHISQTERRAAAAERDALDRFTARFLADKVGARFQARISGIQRFGMFVTLDETGADGLLPVSALPPQRWQFDSRAHTLTAAHGKLTYRLGDEIEVILAEVAPLTGGLIFRLGSGPAARFVPRPQRGKKSGGPPRKRR